jgi:hypothetical protein
MKSGILKAWFSGCFVAARRIPKGDLAVALLLFAVFTGWGGFYLTRYIETVGYTYKLSTHLLVPSALFAEGAGLTNLPPETVPGLKAFLDEETASFTFTGRIPETEKIPLSWFHARHLYLFWTLGIWWGIFGVSWLAFKWLIALFYGISAVLLYSLFRAGMGRAASLAGASLFLFSPAVLTILPSLRDFAKMPFFLAVAGIMLYLIRKPVSRRSLYGAAAAAGIVTGAGFGFRADILACIPAVLAILLLAVKTEGRREIANRSAAAALFLGVFFVVQLPLQIASRDEGGALAARNFTAGLATERDAWFGLDRASYEQIYAFEDGFLHATANSWGHRVLGIESEIPYNSPESARAYQSFALHTLYMFPRDMLARGYAATLRILGNGFLRRPREEYSGNTVIAALEKNLSPLAQFMEWTKLAAAGAVLLILSAFRPRSAWAGLFLTMYFTGYTALQFHFRHYFHLTFISIWFMAFLLDHGTRSLWRLVRDRGAGAELPGACAPRLRNMAIFAVTAAAMLLIPLFLTRLWQERILNGYIAKCNAAPLIQLATQPVPRDTEGGEETAEPFYYRLAEPIQSRKHTDEAQVWEAQTEYIMAAFTAKPEPRALRVRYDAETPFNDFSHMFRLLPSPESSGGVTRYFFPVYQACYTSVAGQPNPYYFFDGRWGRSLFAGIELSADRTEDFLGLYRVKDLDPFQMLLNIQIPPDRADFRYHQRLHIFSKIAAVSSADSG